MPERIISLPKSVIVAANVEFFDLGQLIHKTCKVEGVGGYKTGLALALQEGLPRVVGTIKNITDLPVIYDHQKAGNGIPEIGAKFAKVCKKAGVDAVILYPFVGDVSEVAWIHACQDADLGVLVGAEMTHKDFLRGDGGSIPQEAMDEIYLIAAENGVRDFVVPGNKIDRTVHYKKILETFLGEGRFTLYATGFGSQGGEISEFAKIAGDKWHAIVGRDIYNAPDIKLAASEIASFVIK